MAVYLIGNVIQYDDTISLSTMKISFGLETLLSVCVPLSHAVCECVCVCVCTPV